MRLSPKQCQIASYGGSDKRWTLVSGPVGSGKTFAAGVGFTLNHSRWAGVEFGILTKSHAQLSSLLRQTLEPMAGYEINIDSEGSFTWPSPAGAPNRIRCFVAQDRRAEPRLRSFNLSGGLVEEMTTLPSGILAAMNARCRVGDAKILGLTNPDGPLHPVKVQYFDNLDLLNAQAIYTEFGRQRLAQRRLHRESVGPLHRPHAGAHGVRALGSGQRAGLSPRARCLGPAAA